MFYATCVIFCCVLHKEHIYFLHWPGLGEGERKKEMNKVS